tara:strand:- start:141 stop:575 length:435 start_codon:yes stop_codon:yes gene_type:complete
MYNPDKIVITTILILLLLCAYAVSGAQACVDCDLNKNVKIINTKVVEDKILYNDVREVKNDTEQYCFVKILIKEKDGVVSKEEELYCSDGRKGIDTPSYWELFAQFYYRDIATPEYCRYYSRKKHAFKSYGKVCLNEYGEWKVK